MEVVAYYWLHIIAAVFLNCVNVYNGLIVHKAMFVISFLAIVVLRLF